jgi:hypothetical protein
VLTRLFVLGARVRALFDRRRLDDDFDVEVAAHLAMLTDDNVGRGMSRDEVRRAAVVRFGGAQQLKEQQRDRRGVPLLDTTLQDSRYAVRSLRRHPAFAAGLAAAAALTTLAESLLFGVRAGDPSTYALSLGALAGIAVAACAIPAARAMRVDPLIALRED